MAHVEIGEVALIGNGAPCARHGFYTVRYQPCLQRLLKRLAQEWREHFILFAAGDHFPLTAHGPVAIGLWVGLYGVDEARLVDPAHRKHDRDGHHFVHGVHMRRRTGTMGNVRIPCRVNHAFGKNGFAARFALHNDAADGVAIHDGCDT